ncbi:MAG: NUDIX hydrolase [bacterium]
MRDRFTDDDEGMLLSKHAIQRIIDHVPKRRQMRAGYIPSAILMLFFNRDNRTHLVYIRKTSGPNLHSGQMAFPGGKIDPEDGSSRHAAARETLEEIGVPESCYDYVGEMGFFETLTSRYDAAAHVGWAATPPTYQRSKFEVERIIEIPVGGLYEQLRPHLDFDDYQELVTLNFKFKPSDASEVVNLWGLTARITHHFLQGLHEIYDM